MGRRRHTQARPKLTLGVLRQQAKQEQQREGDQVLAARNEWRDLPITKRQEGRLRYLMEGRSVRDRYRVLLVINEGMRGAASDLIAELEEDS